jgi:hypothetical protein
MDECSLQASRDGEQLIVAWQKAVADVERAKQVLADAEKQHRDASSTLGAWLCPENAALGETFSVWYGASIISSIKQRDGTFICFVRENSARTPLKAG